MKPLIIAIAVIALLIGAGLYIVFGPGGAKEQDAAVIGLNFRPREGASKPFWIDVAIQNQGEGESRIKVEVIISPADLDGTGRIGPTNGTLLAPEEARGISLAFNPDPNVNYTITAIAFTEPRSLEKDLSDNQQQLNFPVYHSRVTLTIQIFKNNTWQTVPVPAGVGLAGGIWANHTLDSWGFPGSRAPMFSQPPQNASFSATIYIEPTRLGRDFTIGEFFDLWGQELTDQCVRIDGYIDDCTGPGGTLLMEVNTLLVPSIKDQHVLLDGEDIWIGFLY